MALSVGDRLGPYEVVGPLGAGGMGQVYRARDSRLGRDVALKILTDLVAHDAERIARFEREARTLAALSHPNIAGIHGLEDSGGIQALVLELVEGPTLADRLANGPMAIDEALAVAKQIVDALEAAHDVGIIHRDLKPANIKLRPDGTVKVLDFGLAKAIAAAHDGGADPRVRAGANLSHSPTITGPISMTGVGVLLGTAAYMPPEQARGKAVDKRADIWAFGCVLFEMLTGKRCFDGEDVSLTLAEVIKSEPDWKALPAATPPAVGSTLQHCLVKDPKRRIRDIGDVRLALEGAFATPLPQVHDWRPWTRRGPGIALAAGLGIVAGAMGGAATLWTTRAEPPLPPTNRFNLVFPAGVTFRDNLSLPLAFTADGRRLILNTFSGNSDHVVIRPMDQVQLQPVQGLEGTVGSIIVSPDGEWIGFNDSKGSLKRMRLSGGPAATIGDTAVTNAGFLGAHWGSAGTIVFSTSGTRGLMEMPEAGGPGKLRTNPANGESHQQPHYLSDGRSLLFVVRTSGQPARIAYLPAGASEYTVLLEGSDPRFVSSGHLLFTRETAVWAVRFDPADGRIAGDPVPVLEGATIATSGIAKMTISGDGTLAYIAGGIAGLRTVVRVRPDGLEEPLPGLAPSYYDTIRASPDGTRLVFDAGRPRSIWTYEFARATSTSVTPTGVAYTTPLWTSDGARVVFTSAGDSGQSRLYWQKADGTGTPEPFPAAESSSGAIRADGWSKDGKTLVATVVRPTGGDLIVIAPDSEPPVRDLIASPAVDAAAAVSPNGEWVAYQSTISGTMEVYVQRFPQAVDRDKISTDGGSSPRWSANGRELFYQSVDGRQVYAVDVAAGPKLTAGKPRLVLEGRYVPAGPLVRPFEVLPDGRFLLIKPEPVGDANVGPTVVIVQNWLAELKRLLPVKK